MADITSLVGQTLSLIDTSVTLLDVQFVTVESLVAYDHMNFVDIAEDVYLQSTADWDSLADGVSVRTSTGLLIGPNIE